MALTISHVNGSRTWLLIAGQGHPHGFVKAVLLDDKPTTCLLPRKDRTDRGAHLMFCPLGFEDRLVLEWEVKDPRVTVR